MNADMRQPGLTCPIEVEAWTHPSELGPLLCEIPEVVFGLPFVADLLPGKNAREVLRNGEADRAQGPLIFAGFVLKLSH